MANSNWRVGDFYFPTDEEPERSDFHPSKAEPLANTHYPNTPFPIVVEQGKGVSNLTIQGKLTNYTEGSTGDFGLEMLEGVCSFEGDERIVVTQAHDGTLRRFYAITGDIRTSIINTQKNLYGYVANFTCYNPFKYDNTLSYTAAISVGATDTTINLGTNCRGTTDGYPTFIIQNETGSTLTDYTMTIGDGTTSGSGNSIVSPSYSIPDDSEIIIHPFKWDSTDSRSHVNSGFLRSAISPISTDVYETYNVSDFTTTAGSVKATYPVIASDTQDFQAKGSATGAKLIVQWRKCYG